MVLILQACPARAGAPKATSSAPFAGFGKKLPTWMSLHMIQIYIYIYSDLIHSWPLHDASAVVAAKPASLTLKTEPPLPQVPTLALEGEKEVQHCKFWFETGVTTGPVCNNGLCNRNLNTRSVKFAVTFFVVVAIVSIEGTFTDSRTSDRPFPSACPTSLRLSPCGVDPRTATVVHGHQLGMGLRIIRYIPSPTATTYYILYIYIYIYISITKSPFSNTKSTFSDTHSIPSSLFHRKTLRRFALNLRR